MSNITAALHPDERLMRKRVARAGAIGNFIEFYDFTLYGFFAVVIAELFFPKFDSVAALLSTFALFGVGFFVRPLGAIAFGYIGDRFGRKRALVIAVGLMSASTAAIGVLPVHAMVGALAPGLLLICRLAQGFSAGGEQTGAFVLVVEHSPEGERGKNAAALIRSVIAGVGAAALLSLVMSMLTTPAQMQAWGWRVPFLVAVPLGMIGLYLRLNIEDSPVYLAAAREIEESRKHHAPIAEAFRIAGKEMLVLFGWVAMQSVAGYILVGFMLSRLVTVERYPVKTALIMLIVAHLVAVIVIPAVGAWGDRVERSTFAVTLALATAAWSVPAFGLLGYGAVAATCAMSVYAVVQYSTMIVSATAVVERFPVSVRYSASALPFQLAYTIFGGTAPFIGTWLTSRFSHLAPAYYIAAMGILAAILARKAFRVSDSAVRRQPPVGCV